MKFSYLGIRFLIIICLCTGLYALYQIYNKNDSSLDSIQISHEYMHKPSMQKASPLIIQSDSDLENIFSNIPEMDWIITGKEQYSVPEYFRAHYTD